MTSTAELREAQMQNLSDIPNCRMAVTMDIGDQYCIHPAKKEEVGERFSYWALAQTYGIKGFAFSGPIYKSMEVKEGKVYLKFDYAENDLINTANHVATMEIAGEDKEFHPAEVSINRDLRLIASSEKVPNPVAVRYGFRNFS